MAKEVNPRLVFDRLFAGVARENRRPRAKRELYRKSILDFVPEDAQQLRQARLRSTARSSTST